MASVQGRCHDNRGQGSIKFGNAHYNTLHPHTHTHTYMHTPSHMHTHMNVHACADKGMLKDKDVTVEPEEANTAELSLVHTPEYLQSLKVSPPAL